MKRPRLICIVVALALANGLLGIHVSRGRTAAGRESTATTHQRVTGVFAVLKRQGLSASLDALERAAAEDSAMLRNGHQLAHALGRQALDLAPGDRSVLGECTPVFASGCYHGVVEAFLDQGRKIDMAELERMCSTTGSEERPAPVYECVHGLGHGVLGAEPDVRSALHHCDVLPEPRFAASCREGVFMEAINSALTQAHHHDPASAHEHVPTRDAGLALDAGNPYAPCHRFGDPYATSCWLFQGFVILRYRNFDAASAFRTCDVAPAARVQRCYESVGFQLTGVFQRGDTWIIEQCARGRAELASSCAAGATAALSAMDWSGARATGFCAAAPASWKEPCYHAAGTMLAVFASPAQRVAVCGRVEREYAKTCRGRLPA
jgi:hypothetical protein